MIVIDIYTTYSQIEQPTNFQNLADLAALKNVELFLVLTLHQFQNYEIG